MGRGDVVHSCGAGNDYTGSTKRVRGYLQQRQELFAKDPIILNSLSRQIVYPRRAQRLFRRDFASRQYLLSFGVNTAILTGVAA